MDAFLESGHRGTGTVPTNRHVLYIGFFICVRYQLPSEPNRGGERLMISAKKGRR